MLASSQMSAHCAVVQETVQNLLRPLPVIAAVSKLILFVLHWASTSGAIVDVVRHCCNQTFAVIQLPEPPPRSRCCPWLDRNDRRRKGAHRSETFRDGIVDRLKLARLDQIRLVPDSKRSTGTILNESFRFLLLLNPRSPVSGVRIPREFDQMFRRPPVLDNKCGLSGKKIKQSRQAWLLDVQQP